MRRRAEWEPASSAYPSVVDIDQRNQLAVAAWSIFKEMQERFPERSFIAPGLAIGNAEIHESLQQHKLIPFPMLLIAFPSDSEPKVRARENLTMMSQKRWEFNITGARLAGPMLYAGLEIEAESTGRQVQALNFSGARVRLGDHQQGASGLALVWKSATGGQLGLIEPREFSLPPNWRNVWRLLFDRNQQGEFRTDWLPNRAENHWGISLIGRQKDQLIRWREQGLAAALEEIMAGKNEVKGLVKLESRFLTTEILISSEDDCPDLMIVLSGLSLPVARGDQPTPVWVLKPHWGREIDGKLIIEAKQKEPGAWDYAFQLAFFDAISGRHIIGKPRPGVPKEIAPRYVLEIPDLKNQGLDFILTLLAGLKLKKE